MSRANRPKRRALTNREFMIIIVLLVVCLLGLGVAAYAVQLPLLYRVVVVLAVAALTFAFILRGRRS
jgi:heme A synthase